MLFRLLVPLLLATALPIAAAEQAVDEFQKLEDAWNTAHLTGDADTLQLIWADDLEVNVPGMPPMSKAEALAFARTGSMRFERYETSDVRTRTYGETTVVTGRLRRTSTVSGQQRIDDWRFTKVYVRLAGAWRVVSFHASESPSA